MKKIEICKQPYKNMLISSGLIYNEKHLLDSVYLELKKDRKPEQNVELRLAPDEAQAIVWVLSGTMFSWLLSNVGRRRMRQIIKQHPYISKDINERG